MQADQNTNHNLPLDSTRDAIAELGAEIGISDEPERRVKCDKMVFAHYMVIGFESSFTKGSRS